MIDGHATGHAGGGAATGEGIVGLYGGRGAWRLWSLTVFQVCREEPLAQSSDIWSLGCTILQMATNRLPWSECKFQHSIPAFYHIATCTEPPKVWHLHFAEF